MTPRDQMDALLDDALNAAITYLQEQGDFAPFAVTLANDGQVVHVNGWEGSDSGTVDSLTTLLIAGLKNGVRIGEYLATAIVSNVALTDRATGKKTDAVRVQIEHPNAEPVTCFAPYHRRGDEVDVGELKAIPGEAVVFGESSV